jgi:hypothetical protein
VLHTEVNRPVERFSRQTVKNLRGELLVIQAIAAAGRLVAPDGLDKSIAEFSTAEMLETQVSREAVGQPVEDVPSFAV